MTKGVSAVRRGGERGDAEMIPKDWGAWLCH